MVKASIEEYRQRAARGDTEALFELAWGHFRGDLLPKDIEMAIALLRQMEERSPQLARFNIAKMKYLVGDASFVDDIRTDCDTGFGPALYLMGIYLNKRGRQIAASEAIPYFRAASHAGHLPSKILLWRFSRLGFWRRLATAIPAYSTAFRFIAISLRNRNDVRVWT
jgi:TPR repeat protein